MQLEAVSHDHQVALADALNQIYRAAAVEKTYSDDSAFLKEIIQIVVENNFDVDQQELIIHGSSGYGNRSVTWLLGCSYSMRPTGPMYRGFITKLSLPELLTKRFGEKFNHTLDKSCLFAYRINTKLGHSVDLAGVVCPYILYELGITGEKLSFYLGLGMVLAKIVCDSLSQMHAEKLEAAKDSEQKEVYAALKGFLEKAGENTADPEAVQQISNSLEQITGLMDQSC